MEMKLIRYLLFFTGCVIISYIDIVFSMQLPSEVLIRIGLLPPKPVPSQPIQPTGPLSTPPKSITPDQPVSKVEKSLEQQQSTHDVLPSSSDMSSGSPLVSSLPSTSSPVVSTVEIGVGTDDLAHQPSVRTMETQTTEIPQESRNPSTTLTMNLQGRTSAHFSIDISDSTSTTFNPERRNSVFPMSHPLDPLIATSDIHSGTVPTCNEDSVQFHEVIIHNFMELRTEIAEVKGAISEMKGNLKELTEQLKILMVHFKKSE